MKFSFNKYKRLNWWHVILTSVAFCIILLFSIYRFNSFGILGKIPSQKDLESINIPLSSTVYSEDSVLLFKFYYQKRDYTKWNDIPKLFAKGLVSVEDARYYEHSGIDWQSNLSILWYLLKGDKRGGSTLTQQLVKNLFNSRKPENQGLLHKIPGCKLLAIKLSEWNIATRLEKIYSKDEILHMYINTVDFGGNHFGLTTSSRYFFNKKPSELSINECATLIGVLKASTSYHPILHPEKCKERRNVVLKLFKEHKLIDNTEYENLISKDVFTTPTEVEQVNHKSIYIKLAVEKELNQWCKLNNYNLYTDGLNIYTTINSTLQKHAQDAVKEHMVNIQRKFYKHWEDQVPWRDSKRKVIPNFLEQAMYKTKRYVSLKKKYGADTSTINKVLNSKIKMSIFTWKGVVDTIMSPYDSLKYYKMFMQAGFITMDPHTGFIKSWIGSNDYRYFRLDHINQSKRQPGSTFKPFIYATAIENGMTPCDKVVDKMIVHRYKEDGKNKIWIPKNSNRVYSEDTMTLRFAMGRSINSVAAQVSIKYTADSVMSMAKRLGIKSPLKAVPSAGLGSNEVDLLELTSSYTAFINKGVSSSPIIIEKINDRENNELFKAKPIHKQVLTPEVAWTMSYMLRGTLDEPFGTSQALFQNGNITHKNHLGGKTGTSSNYADGWYIGVSKDLIGGVWVGADDQSIHFRTSTLGEGMKTALPIFGKFMQKAYADSSSGVMKSFFDKKPRNVETPDCKTKVRIIPYEMRTDSLKVDSLEFYIDWPKIGSTSTNL